MNSIYILGTAGSGKSALTAALLDILRADNLNVATVNLDPGVKWLPYGPDVDIRDYINYDRVAEEYQLGPNGALIVCVDTAINYIKEMRQELEKLEPDYVLIDTPGQMELFAYRDSGILITSTLSKEGYSIIFLADSIFLNRPSDFISIVLLSYSIHVRFRAPQINCISKADLLSEENLKKASEWLEEPIMLKEAFLSETVSLKREISEKIFEALMEIGGLGEFIFISSYSGLGMDNLYAQIQRIHTGGINI